MVVVVMRLSCYVCYLRGVVLLRRVQVHAVVHGVREVVAAVLHKQRTRYTTQLTS